MPFSARSLQVRLAPILSHLHLSLWWLRSKSLGVRLVVLDGDHVFLVRHTYRPGWYLPGGGVDRGETPEAAAVRELLEEGGLVAQERPTLLNVYRNGRHDYVICYAIRHVSRTQRMPDWEIAETGFFPVYALPEGTTRATRARLAELLDGQTVQEDW